MGVIVDSVVGSTDDSEDGEEVVSVVGDEEGSVEGFSVGALDG